MTKDPRTRTALIAALLAVVGACTCDDSELYGTASPKGKRTLVVCSRNCGATAGFTTVIKERSGGFARQVDLVTIGGEALGEKDLKIEWVGEDEIVLSVDPKLAVVLAKPFPSDLKVTYAPGTRLGS